MHALLKPVAQPPPTLHPTHAGERHDPTTDGAGVADGSDAVGVVDADGDTPGERAWVGVADTTAAHDGSSPTHSVQSPAALTAQHERYALLAAPGLPALMHRPFPAQNDQIYRE